MIYLEFIQNLGSSPQITFNGKAPIVSQQYLSASPITNYGAYLDVFKSKGLYLSSNKNLNPGVFEEVVLPKNSNFSGESPTSKLVYSTNLAKY